MRLPRTQGSERNRTYYAKDNEMGRWNHLLYNSRKRIENMVTLGRLCEQHIHESMSVTHGIFFRVPVGGTCRTGVGFVRVAEGLVTCASGTSWMRISRAHSGAVLYCEKARSTEGNVGQGAGCWSVSCPVIIGRREMYGMVVPVLLKTNTRVTES